MDAKLLGSLIAITLACGGCQRYPKEVAGPFYLDYGEDQPVALFRCPKGPANGCANDGLPETVIAAGGSRDFIVVQNTAGYYYFKRLPEERYGWGDNPEKIIGPLSSEEFSTAKRRLGLPELTVRP